jgi:glycine/D-amino acid oxidase-like deaminating enzyme
MKPIQIGLFGLGTVGSGTYEVLKRNQVEIQRRLGKPLVISMVADLDTAKAKSLVGSDCQVVADARQVIANPDIDIVVELIGGYGIALELVMSAIEAGKHVVTANKALLAMHGNEIFKAAQRKGVQLNFDHAVQALTPTRTGISVRSLCEGAVHDAEFKAVVVCAGVASRALAASLGDRVNVYPVKGSSITVDLPDEASRAAAPVVSLLDDRARVACSRLGEGRLRVAGTAEFNGEDRDIRASRIQPLVGWVRQNCPTVNTRHAIPWAGLRPMMPNLMPRVGPGARPGVFYNTGHGHLGWTLAAATAELVADAVQAAHPHAAN